MATANIVTDAESSEDEQEDNESDDGIPVDRPEYCHYCGDVLQRCAATFYWEWIKPHFVLDDENPLGRQGTNAERANFARLYWCDESLMDMDSNHAEHYCFYRNLTADAMERCYRCDQTPCVLFNMLGSEIADLAQHCFMNKRRTNEQIRAFIYGEFSQELVDFGILERDDNNVVNVPQCVIRFAKFHYPDEDERYESTVPMGDITLNVVEDYPIPGDGF